MYITSTPVMNSSTHNVFSYPKTILINYIILTIPNLEENKLNQIMEALGRGISLILINEIFPKKYFISTGLG